MNWARLLYTARMADWDVPLYRAYVQSRTTLIRPDLPKDLTWLVARYAIMSREQWQLALLPSIFDRPASVPNSQLGCISIFRDGTCARIGIEMGEVINVTELASASEILQCIGQPCGSALVELVRINLPICAPGWETCVAADAAKYLRDRLTKRANKLDIL